MIAKLQRASASITRLYHAVDREAAEVAEVAIDFGGVHFVAGRREPAANVRGTDRPHP